MGFWGFLWCFPVFFCSFFLPCFCFGLFSGCLCIFPVFLRYFLFFFFAFLGVLACFRWDFPGFLEISSAFWVLFYGFSMSFPFFFASWTLG